MKKSLIALAVLAASGAAMAQSSVTLYGIADVWVGNVSVDNGTTDTSTSVMTSGGVSTSRWGMKGSEDLGGGLKANFNFESAVGVDTGASSGFTRQAWVGLSGGFGDVRFGLNNTPYDSYAASVHGVFDSDVSPMYLGAFPSLAGYNAKAANSFKYVSPSMGGLSAEVLYAMDEETVATGTSASNGLETTSFALRYTGGPIYADLVYQSDEAYNTNLETERTKVGVSYNFGVATAKAHYINTSDFKAAGADVDEWQIAVDVPLSAAMTLSANYATADYNVAAGDKESTGYSIALAYSLSKRTTVYGGYGSVTTEKTGIADVDTTAYAVGIKHVF